MQDSLLYAGYLILPSLASLAITHMLKERLGLDGYPYPWVTRILRWTLWITIIYGVLLLAQVALGFAVRSGNSLAVSAVSALYLMQVLLLLPTWIGAYFAWYATPLIFWAQATSAGRSARRKMKKRRTQ